MDAGDINIKITASMQEFDRTMAAVKAAGDGVGQDTGRGFSAGFKRYVGDVASDFASQFQNKVRAAMGATSFVSALRGGLEAAAQGADIGAAFAQGIKSIPFIGAMASALEQGIVAALGESDILSDIEKAKAKNIAAESRLATLEKERLDQRTTADEIFSRRKVEMMRLELRQAELVGDERLVAEKRAAIAYTEARNEFDRQIQANGIATTPLQRAREELIQKSYDQELEFIQRNLDVEYAMIDKKNREAAEKAAKEEDDRKRDLEEKRIRDLEQKRARIREQAEKQISDLSDRRDRARTAGIGSASTALGMFKFDAYPDTLKRTNDERMVRAIELMKDVVVRNQGGLN